MKAKIKSIFALLFIFLFLPFIGLFILLNYLKGLELSRQVKNGELGKGKHILFIYSNSPIWKSYVEEHILPKIKEQAVVINWSERDKWEDTFEIEIFKHFAGVSKNIVDGKKNWYGHEFCPLAIVFKPVHKPQVIRFWEAFKDFKHGNTELLEAREKELFEMI